VRKQASALKQGLLVVLASKQEWTVSLSKQEAETASKKGAAWVWKQEALSSASKQDARRLLEAPSCQSLPVRRRRSPRSRKVAVKFVVDLGLLLRLVLGAAQCLMSPSAWDF
jgi:hypothetical protein